MDERILYLELYPVTAFRVLEKNPPANLGEIRGAAANYLSNLLCRLYAAEDDSVEEAPPLSWTPSTEEDEGAVIIEARLWVKDGDKEPAKIAQTRFSRK